MQNERKLVIQHGCHVVYLDEQLNLTSKVAKISTHNNNMGDKERSVVLHLADGRKIFLEKQYSNHSECHMSLGELIFSELGLFYHPQLKIAHVGGGKYDCDDKTTYIPIVSGCHDDDIPKAWYEVVVKDLETGKNFISGMKNIYTACV